MTKLTKDQLEVTGIEHPNTADWRNRAERAEAECAELRAAIDDNKLHTTEFDVSETAFPSHQTAMEDALLAVLAAVRTYLPPDSGIAADVCIGDILEAIDNPTINPVIAEIEKRRGEG